MLFWVVLAFSVVVFSINAQAEEPLVVDRIVAVVNDEIITLYDLNETLKPYEENIQALGYSPEKLRETLFKLRSDVLNQLVDQKLADQQIKKNNLTISVQEIDMTIERIKESRRKERKKGEKANGEEGREEHTKTCKGILGPSRFSYSEA